METKSNGGQQRHVKSNKMRSYRPQEVKARLDSYERTIFEVLNHKNSCFYCFIQGYPLCRNGVLVRKQRNCIFIHGLLNMRYKDLMTMASMSPCFEMDGFQWKFRWEPKTCCFRQVKCTWTYGLMFNTVFMQNDLYRTDNEIEEIVKMEDGIIWDPYGWWSDIWII